MSEVFDTPLINKSDTVTIPDIGETIPATGGSVAVQRTGINPTNLIAQRLPQTVDPVIVAAAKGAPGTTEGGESTVVPTPGGN